MKKTTLILLLILFNFVHAQTYFNGTTFGGNGIDVTYDSALDSQSNLYTVGLYQTSLTVGTTTITSNGGNADGFLAKHDSNGNPVWVKSFGGALDDVAVNVTIDTNDNIYLTGYFQGAGVNAFDADPGPDIYALEQQAFFVSRDCFIIKLDSNGNFIWAKQISNPSGGAANEDATSIELDSSGNVYIAGSFLYADFDPDPVTTHILPASPQFNHGFLLKLNNNGEFVWVKTFDSNAFANNLDIELDNSNNIYVTGQFQGSIDLDPSASEDNYTSIGGFDVFMAKLDNNGNYIYGKTFGSVNNDYTNVISVLPSGIYLGGSFSGTVDFDPGIGTTIISPINETDGFISKFDTSGNFQYVYPIGGDAIGIEEVYNIQEVNENLMISGNFVGVTDFDYSSATENSDSSGGLDAYFLELTTSGNYKDHLTLGGVQDEGFTNFELNTNNEVLLFGSFKSSPIDLNPYAGIDNHNNIAQYDNYISRFITSALLSVADFTTNNEIIIYPNPTKNIISIKSRNNTLESYKLYNTLGQLSKQGNIIDIDGSIDISEMAKGVYYLKLYSSKNTFIKKIIKK